MDSPDLDQWIKIKPLLDLAACRVGVSDNRDLLTTERQTPPMNVRYVADRLNKRARFPRSCACIEEKAPRCGEVDTRADSLIGGDVEMIVVESGIHSATPVPTDSPIAVSFTLSTVDVSPPANSAACKSPVY